MTDLATLKAAVDEAEGEKESLLVERRANRVSMTKYDFIAYNTSTREDQIAVEAAVKAATKAFQDAATTIRSEAINVAIGTIAETNTPVGGGD